MIEHYDVVFPLTFGGLAGRPSENRGSIFRPTA